MQTTNKRCCCLATLRSTPREASKLECECVCSFSSYKKCQKQNDGEMDGGKTVVVVVVVVVIMPVWSAKVHHHCIQYRPGPGRVKWARLVDFKVSAQHRMSSQWCAVKQSPMVYPLLPLSGQISNAVAAADQSAAFVTCRRGAPPPLQT